MMKEHLEAYNSEIQSKVDLTPGDCVLDIGSNDSTFLSFYPSSLKRVGCDPTGKQFSKYYHGIDLVPDYFTKENIQPLGNKYKVVSSISMFYDLPDPVQFAKDVFDILEDDGVWSLEQSYILTMLQRRSIDTICHEHIEYYSLRQIKLIMDIAGFKIIDVSKNDCNGGSFRIYVAKASSAKYTECHDVIQTYLTLEKEYGLDDTATYKKFIDSCDHEISKLKMYLEKHPNTYIYGASTKGNCLLQYANITDKHIRYAVERNLDKIGKMTSTGIEIIGEDQMRASPPEALLVLPWHFRNDIIKREHVYLKSGGNLLFPFPRFEIYNHYKGSTFLN